MKHTLNNAEISAQVLGIPIVGTSLNSLLTKIDGFVSSSLKSGPKLVVTANPEIIMLAQDDPEYKKILQSADLAFADGAGLRLAASNLTVTPGRKVVQELVGNRKYSLFYLGGKEGVAAAMAKKYGGNFDAGEPDIKNSIRNNEIVDSINATSPDVLLVAYGAPWQEKWIWENRSKLKAKVAMGVGGSFDYLIGKTALPPLLIEKLGLEWLWRLILQPWRWRRQMNLIRFALRVLA